MIPIHNKDRTRRFTWVTVALVVANIATFAYEVTRPAEEIAALLGRWGFSPAQFFADPTNPAVLLTLLTTMFLHGSWVHLIGNMLYLWIFGPNIETRFGAWRFVLFYTITGIVATLAQAAVDPTSSALLIGSSGAIAGVLGAYLILFPRTRIVTVVPVFFYFELAAVPAAFVVGFWFLMQVAQGLGSITGTALSTVAWWAHVAGFVVGAGVAIPLALADMLRRTSRKKR